MTDAEQTVSTAQFEWTKGKAERAEKAPSALLGKILVLVGFLLAGAAAILFVLARVNAGVNVGQFPLLIPGLAGVIMVALGFLSSNARRSQVAKTEAAKSAAQREEAAKAELRLLRSELSARSRAESDIRVERDTLRSQVEELTRANAAVSSELERRRLAEKTMSQQQLELVRSKDVLQLHVQARTQELAKLQRRSELILNAVGEGICGFDLNGKITFANPEAAEIMRMPVDKLIGLQENEVFSGFRPNKDSAHPTELTARRPDGTSFVAEFVRSPLTEEGREIGEVLLFKDITERRHAEEALAQQAAELTRSNAELEQFAFVASHDLQEPLRKIQAFGDRLKTKCEEANLDSGRDYLERMQSAAARMRRLIDDLLTFSRVISRTEPFAPVDLATVVNEVLSDLEVSVEKSGATIEVGELPTIDADAVQMRQLMQNLIGNALKFQPPGGKPVVKISGRFISQAVANGQTSMISRKPGDATVVGDEQICELIVQDNGIGFDEKYLEKIFAVFQRLHGRQEYEGTGIGLAVCRRIMDRHNGKITAHSKPGEGATFVMHLPVQQEKPTPKPS